MSAASPWSPSPHRELSLPASARQLVVAAIVLIACWWCTEWLSIRTFMEDVPADVAPAPVALATIAVGGHAVALALEALFYVTWWGTWGKRLPYGRFLAWIALFSALDLVARAVGGLTQDDPTLRAWLAPFVGIRGWSADADEAMKGLWAGFGSFGVLTIARLVLTAERQSAALEVPLRKTLALTAGAWVVSHAALVWTLDLARGVSPTP